MRGVSAGQWGLFQGVGLAQDAAVAETGRMPNMVFLYRRPILDYWAEHDDTLGAVVTHVLVHEIGHHFGLSDADIEAIDRRRSRMSREDDARRALERMESEAEKLFSTPPQASAEDRIEVLGRRIGRILGYVLAIALIVYLYATYLT